MDDAGEAGAVFLEEGAGAQGFAGDGGDELVSGPCHFFVFHQSQDVDAAFGAPAGDVFFHSVHAEVDLAAGAAALAFFGGLLSHRRHLLILAGWSLSSRPPDL